MMRFTSRQAVFTAIFGIMAALLIAGGFIRSTRAQVGPPNNGAVPFMVGYDDSEGLDPNTEQLYQNIVLVLDGFVQVPDARLAYYSAVNNNNGFVITDWQAIISSVQPDDNGYIVTLAVNASLSSGAVGADCTILDSDYSEVYQVNNDNTIQYLNSLDPQGLAGQLPSNIAGL